MKIKQSMTMEEYRKWILANQNLKHTSLMDCATRRIYISYDLVETKQ